MEGRPGRAAGTRADESAEGGAAAAGASDGDGTGGVSVAGGTGAVDADEGAVDETPAAGSLVTAGAAGSRCDGRRDTPRPRPASARTTPATVGSSQARRAGTPAMLRAPLSVYSAC